jgi:hypothetical protein
MHSTPHFPLPSAAATPWYRHRWPWMLMAGPAIVVVAGSFTFYLAASRPDAMVVDDYYKQGKAINQDLRRDRRAAELGLMLAARIDPATRTLSGNILSAQARPAGTMRMYLAHPTLPGKDIVLSVPYDKVGNFTVPLPNLDRARWRIVLEGEQREWRLSGSWKWPQERDIVLDAAANVAP